MRIRYKFGGLLIAAAGYNAQCELLEIEFGLDGEIRQYFNVPENIWYCFKSDSNPEVFFHRYIKGQYTERQLISEEE